MVKKKITSPAIVKRDIHATIKEMKSPIHGKFRGYRLIAGMARSRSMFGKEVSSIASKDTLYIEGDYSRNPDDDQIRRFEGKLKGFPFNATRVIWI